jgi:hypothetical protein
MEEIATTHIAIIEHHARGTCMKIVFATGPWEISIGSHQKIIQSIKIFIIRVEEIINLLII